MVIDERDEQIATLTAEIEQLCASILHDLASPVRAITGFVSLIEETLESGRPEEIREMLGVIKNESARLGDMMDGLVIYSRLSRQHVSRSAIEMKTLASERVAAQMKERSGPLVRWQIGELPPAEGDRQLLAAVWDRLIANALKFSNLCEDPAIEITGETQGREALYVIKDNGAGFDPRFVKRLFCAFGRLHRPDEFPGVGLGLALVQRVVARHGGRVWADASLGEGATFGFSLPLDAEPR